MINPGVKVAYREEQKIQSGWLLVGGWGKGDGNTLDPFQYLQDFSRIRLKIKQKLVI